MAKGLNLLRAMTAIRRVFLVLVLVASAARADWRNVAPGVDYQEYRGDNYDIHCHSGTRPSEYKPGTKIMSATPLRPSERNAA